MKNRSDPTEDSEELVHSDDRIIGKAARWSLGAVVILAALFAGAVLIMKRKPAPGAPQMTQLSAPVLPDRPQAEMPTVKFTDITKEAGITFIHNNGAYGDKLLPETMGGGVAFFDFDDDGAQDLVFVNSSDWPWHVSEGKPPTTLALYRNDGRGHFTDVTKGSGLAVNCYGMGVAIGDYDNDGRDDVLVTAVGGNHLFHNEGGGKFREVTHEADVFGSTNDWSTCAAFFDYDNDGKLDLFVGNYVQWSKEIDAEVGFKIDGRTRAYGQPMNFAGAFPRLYHGEGGGRFSEVSARSGLQVKNPATGVPAAKVLGVAPVDVDGDGWMDLVLANDTVPNLVFINQHDGTFKEIGAQSGVAFDNCNNARRDMGIDSARYRNDGKLGIAIGNFANEMTALCVAQNSPCSATKQSPKVSGRPAGYCSSSACSFSTMIWMAGWICSPRTGIWRRRSARFKRARSMSSPRNYSGTPATAMAVVSWRCPRRRPARTCSSPSSAAARRSWTLTATATSTWC
ncbi:MAG: VCBS repeat-containing protein [Verrucomicrobiota bacterium]